ncbi:hypothetical protein [Hydrogenophaga sp.]|uniref:hypothetical protein n=1 Tax=Hydrogenophaga sp. TaxID=1904254 RepID=UPI00169E69C3|nr:hypothetical protein [Hydrogenophaga sp.]NIM42608.1 hypothetical protein [Hydrogenophaga sp.]NIN30313.1 hypothetical protein [Hydrogenophaga sp.]NIO91237.1 hypothetical protein [Hydrogenophaga sp.]
MRDAPSVSYPVGRSRFWATVLTALALAVVLTGAWMASTVPPEAWLPLAGAGLAWMAWAARSERQQPTGLLRFSGSTGRGGTWRWALDGTDEGLALQAVEAAVDLQNRMLLRLKGSSGVPAWVWVERVDAPVDWLALRRAVTSDRPG